MDVIELRGQLIDIMEDSIKTQKDEIIFEGSDYDKMNNLIDAIFTAYDIPNQKLKKEYVQPIIFTLTGAVMSHIQYNEKYELNEYIGINLFECLMNWGVIENHED